MFFDDLNKPKKPTPRLFSDFSQGVVCAILAVVCIVVYRNSWGLSVIFALLAVFRFWHHFKMKKNKIKLNAVIDNCEDDDDDEDDEGCDSTPVNATRAEKLSRKERKKRYKEFLEEIENSFSDFDVED